LLKLSDDSAGARIDGILPVASTETVLRPDDVLLRVGTYSVADDGTILYEGNRVSAALAFQLAQNGECVPLEIWRDGQRQEVSLPVYRYDGDRSAGYQYDILPRYFVYGGLVFTPLSLDFMRTLGRGARDADTGDFSYELYYRRYEKVATARAEPIVLASVLPDAVNANVSVRGRALVDQINGIRVEKLEDVVRAFETCTNAQDLIQFAQHQGFDCLDRSEVAKANDGILKTYGIASDRRL
jgi:hypothetical protein